MSKVVSSKEIAKGKKDPKVSKKKKAGENKNNEKKMEAILKRLAYLEKKQKNEDWINHSDVKLLLIHMKHWMINKLQKIEKVLPECSLNEYQKCLTQIANISEQTFVKEAEKNSKMFKFLKSLCKRHPQSNGKIIALPEFMRQYLNESVCHAKIKNKEYLQMNYLEQGLVNKEILLACMDEFYSQNYAPSNDDVVLPDDSISIANRSTSTRDENRSVRSVKHDKKSMISKRSNLQNTSYAHKHKHHKKKSRNMRERDDISEFSVYTRRSRPQEEKKKQDVKIVNVKNMDVKLGDMKDRDQVTQFST